MMKKYVIILLLLLVNIVYGENIPIILNGFPNAIQTGHKQTTASSPTCGVFTCNPRVETIEGKNYYLIDLYAVRFQEWTSNTEDKSDNSYYDNCIGSFNITFEQEPSGGSSNWYGNKFNHVEFQLADTFTTNLDAKHVNPVVVANFGQFGLSNIFAFAYASNGAYSVRYGPWLKKVKLENEREPLMLGTLKCEIKDPTKSAGMILAANSTTTVFSTDGKETAACVGYTVVGYLDKSPDIPLKPEAVDTAPETPLLADGLKNLFCQNEAGRFTIKGTTLPARATTCDWYVSATPKGAKITDTNKFTMSPDAGGALGCTITWLQAGTYYVNVFSSNATEHSKDTTSMQVTVKAMPDVKMLVDGGSHTTAKISKCAGTEVTLSVTSTGLTYVWEGTSGTVTGSSTKQILANAGTTALDKKYKVTGTQNDCSASDSVVFTVNPLPDVQLSPTTGAYPSGQTLEAKVTLNSGSGTNLQYNWTKPEVKTNGGATLEFVVKETDPTDIAVTVVNSVTSCFKNLTGRVTDNGNGLKVNLTALSNTICQNGVGRLKAVISGGNMSYTCSWYAGQDLTVPALETHTGVTGDDYFTVDPALGLTYTLKVSDGILVVTRQITLTKDNGHTAIAVNTIPEIRAVKNAQVVLIADPVTADVGTNTYAWEPVNRLATASEKDKQYALTAGLATDQSYDVLMTNVQNGVTCISKGTTLVKRYADSEADPLLVSVDPETITLCKNSTLNFITSITGAGTGSADCEWKPSLGLSNPRIPNPLFTAANVGSTGLKEYTLVVKKGGQTATKRVSVHIADATAPVLSFANEVYCTDSLLKVNVAGGSVTAYTWTVQNKTTNNTSTHSTNVPQYSIADAGQYTVSVMGETANCKTNRVGPKDIDLRKISVNMQVVPSSYKSGESVVATVTPTGGWGNADASVYFYTWSKPVALAEQRGKNTNTVTGAWENKYDFQVKVRDVNNCSAIATGSATIQAGGLTLELAQVNAFCNGGSAMMTATAHGGSGKYTYVWKAGANTVQTNQVANNTPDNYFAETPVDTYTVTVTDETSPKALTVTKNITLTKNGANAPVIDAGGPQIAVAKANDVAILAAELVTPTKAPYTWQWTGQFTATADAQKQVTQSAPITANTTYSVYAIDGNGCISKPDQVSVMINATDNFGIIIDAEGTMCASASQQLSTTLTPTQTGATYHWTVAPELTIDNANLPNPVITASKAGSYVVGVTVTVNGVKRTAQKAITVTNDKLPVLALTYGAPLCQGDTVRVKNTEATVTVADYKWYIGGVYAGTGDKLPLPVGDNVTIKVVATSTQKCVVSKEEIKSFKAQPLLAWDAVSDIQEATTEIELNIEKTAKVVATPNSVTYSWTKPGVKAGDSYAVTALPTDVFIEFEAVATDNNTGCKSNRLYKKLTVVKDELNITAGALYAVCNGGSAVLAVSKIEGSSGPFKYEWKKEGSSVVLGSDSIYVAQNITATQKYSVTVTKAGTSKIGVGEITVTPKAGTIPTVTACDDITIITGNKAALYATTTATGVVDWNWGPVGTKLSAQEARKQSPQTEVLNADQKFGVYVVNGEQCVSRVDSVNVHVVADAPDVLKVEIVPDMELCLGNETKFKAVVTGGSGNITSCTWLPGDMLPVAGDQLMATYVVKKAGKDTITVVVKKGSQTVTAKKEITIRGDQAPKLKFDNLAIVKCTGNNLTVSSEGTNISGDYSWVINGRYMAGNLTNQYTFDQAGNYHVQVIAKGVNNCMADTLSKDISITATPQLAVSIEENCGEARLVAVASDATAYTWTPVTVTGLGGETLTGSDSIFRVKTNLMSEGFEYKVMASNTNCQSEERSLSGTVYGLPDTIILNPYMASVYPDEQVEITASYTPDLDYTLNWTGSIESQNGKAIKTNPLTDPSNSFTLTVANKIETTCKVSNTSIITVSSEDFRIYFDQDTMDLCLGVEGEFVARNMNCKNLPIDYTFTSTYPGFAPVSQDDVREKQATTRYTFNQTGNWKLYASGKDASGAVRRDSVVVRVNPVPTLRITSPEDGIPQSLCLNKGEVKINMTATNGVAGWTFKYKLNSVQKTDRFTDANHTLILKEGGTFVADSIVNSKGCHAPVEFGVKINDDVPKISLTTAELTKCQGTETNLGLKISDTTKLDYQLAIHYRIDGALKATAYVDAEHKFSITDPGSYRIDSIVSQRGCVYRLTTGNTVVVEEYLEPVPVLTLTDKNPKEFCAGNSVNIPVNVTTGHPSYTITYTLGGVQKTETLGASGNIVLSDNGPFILKDFKDANGCGQFTLDETVQVTKNAKPAMEITSTSKQMCGGQLDLALKLSAGVAPYTITYKVDGGVVQTKEITAVGADKTAVWNITDAGVYTITKVEDQHCEIAGTDVVGGPDFTVTPLRLYVKLKNSADICASAGAEIELDFTKTEWPDVKGKVRVTYEFTPAGGSVSETKTIEFEKIVAQANPVITPVPQGTYVLKDVADLGAAGCQGIMSQVESDNKITVIDAPVVEIDSVNFALYKNEAFELGVKNLNPDGSNKFDYAWQIDNGNFDIVNAPFSIRGTMGDKDMQYVLKGTNRTKPSCYNTDTVQIYRIPDAPGLTIDTNRTRNELKLTWLVQDLRQVDGFTIMSNRWDAYGLESDYQVESEKVSKNNTSYTISESSIFRDTMKVYYIQAYRKVKTSKGEKTYLSHPSDTLGYYAWQLKTYTGSSYNLISYLFDMSPKIKTTTDIVNFLGGKENVQAIQKFSIEEQDWSVSRYAPFPPPGSWENEMNVQVGDVYMIDMLKERNVVMYGSLKRKTWDLKQGEVSSFNMLYLHFEKSTLKTAESVANDMGGKDAVQGIQYWNPALQDWAIMRYSLFPPPGGWVDSFRVYPGCPFMIDIKNNIIWR